MDNTTAVLQLCVDTKCLIVQMFFMDYIPESLKNFLSDPNVTFVGVEVARDVAKLKNEYGLQCSSIADVRDLTLKRWPYVFYRKPGLKDVARLVVGLEMPKPKNVCRSDWQSRVLDDLQIEYACIDAYASFKIGHKLLKEIRGFQGLFCSTKGLYRLLEVWRLMCDLRFRISWLFDPQLWKIIG
ncbi:hypothetical protein LWI29_009985 [Acer saccharum]|uniref:3'-5' exonuclease domain-containing protein n=1 Tax=Acer saccharum TaxID=4024 RepID=A0AA39RVR5_ACESA|nr:hypothetical protein LWI29_009985 [Acer saccharum]